MSIAATPRTTGQPAIGSVRPAKPVFCVDIGGSFMKFAVSPAPGALVPLEKVATPAANWDDLAASLATLIERNAQAGDPASPLALCSGGVSPPASSPAPLADPEPSGRMETG